MVRVGDLSAFNQIAATYVWCWMQRWHTVMMAAVERVSVMRRQSVAQRKSETHTLVMQHKLEWHSVERQGRWSQTHKRLVRHTQRHSVSLGPPNRNPHPTLVQTLHDVTWSRLPPKSNGLFRGSCATLNIFPPNFVKIGRLRNPANKLTLTDWLTPMKTWPPWRR